MQLLTRALVALVAAGSVPATVAARHAAPRQECAKTYSAHMFARAARIIYRGSHTPTRRELDALHRFARCSRTSRSHARALHFWHDARIAWRARQVAQAAMNSGLASWYSDGGSTASGFHSYYGVAVCGSAGPCFSFGTRILFRYGGREVTAVVDDHGPYAGGRNFDLNQNTAQALGFGGVGTVAWRVVTLKR